MSDQGNQGKFKKSISLLDLTLIGMGAIFGSAWLFAVSNVASKAAFSRKFFVADWRSHYFTYRFSVC